MALPAASHQEGALCSLCLTRAYVHLSITTASGLLWDSPNNKNENASGLRPAKQETTERDKAEDSSPLDLQKCQL